jgi:hypothetical protein
VNRHDVLSQGSSPLGLAGRVSSGSARGARGARGGHPTFSPDGNWIATDAGDGKKKEKLLMLYSMKTGEGQVLGSFPMREYMSGDLRCDLHPRWNRSGNAVCFDALETKGWTRQLHVAQLEL